MTPPRAVDAADEVLGQGLLRPARPVVVMYSGGRDSTCLLHLAVGIAGASVVCALHVNYGLREAAAEDERHCRQRCAQLGVDLEVRAIERREIPSAGNLQAWARDRRYAAATELARVRDADVATGHTATDQVETILYRLASSPSRRALLGMAPRTGTRPPFLIRPLLGLTRASTAAYCREHGLSWREDESNEVDAYARSRIRHELVPALERAHPAAQANVLAVAEILRAEGAVLDELVDDVLRAGNEISLARLRRLPAALRRLVVQRLADAAAGGPAAGVGRRADEVAAMPDRGRAALDLPSGVRVTVEGGLVRFGRQPGERARGPRLGRQEERASARGGGVRASGAGATGAASAGAPADATKQGAKPLTSKPVSNDPAIGEILVPAEDLRRRVRELGEEVSRDYAGKNLLLIGVLKGAVFFLSDLMRHLEVSVEVDFMAVASYGSATKSSGVVRILKDLDVAIEGRDVLIVEDIVDSGLTLRYLLRNLAGRNPASLEVCALLIKPTRRKVDLKTRYVGFEIPDEFAIGYGLDHAERYRNLPYVAALRQ